ncbi:GMC family oxidoreductase [Candidatus Fermentibacteria bacterium]|nr:GMC family oxidoreductase [Candidatus Fermentibacteria bacterium]
MKTAVVVGSGAGGATVARELQGAFQVTVLEAGGRFEPYGMSLGTMQRLKRARLLVSPRLIRVFFPPMRVAATGDMLVVSGRAVGGTTTLSTGNAVRADSALRAMGINLDDEFRRLYGELPIGTGHQARWRPITRRLWSAFKGAGLSPQPMPKVGEYHECVQCGRCVLGCPRGVKWDSRRLIAQAQTAGAELHTGWFVTRVQRHGGEVSGVWARRGPLWRFFPADVVVLAAGGLGTPAILQRSGLPFEKRLFVDPVLCVAGLQEGVAQCEELPMPFYTSHDGFMLSPYFDFVSFLFDPSWPSGARGIVGVMIKLADTPTGSIDGTRIDKRLSSRDMGRLDEAGDICSEVLERIGVAPGHQFRGLLNAGHPGGMVRLTGGDTATLHPAGLPPNLFVADASLFPTSLGAPPIMTIMALSLRISGRISAQHSPTAKGRRAASEARENGLASGHEPRSSISQ